MGTEKSEKLGFLDSIVGLFQARGVEGAPASAERSTIDADFDAALRRLDETLDASKRAREPELAERSRGQTAEELVAERKRRTEAAHQSMRQDIDKMHARLGTGVKPADLEGIEVTLHELQALSDAGRDSHALLPRGRYAIAERMQKEAGRLAVEGLVQRLERAGIGWPDPMSHHPSATPDEIEGAHRRRLAEMRETFLTNGFERTRDRMLGIVRGWGSDYPPRGTALWEEAVLEGVAAGMRGKLVVEFFEVLRRDRDEILSQVESLLGKDLDALRGALQGGVASIEQASRAADSALRVLDEVLPQLAWERILAELPQARSDGAP